MSTHADWFHGAALGIFIHFGHAASRGWELSWQMTGGVVGQFPPREPVACEEYFANAESFDPRAFDAKGWVQEIAATGATYVVFTTKHHDGFAMFDSALSDYSIARTAPFGRDLLRELVDALRERDLRIGFYFSLPDWHHEAYPRMTDATVHKPYRVGEYVRTDAAQWGEFRDFMLGQVTELLTNYGTVDIMWFDGEFDHTAEEWDFAAIREHVRALQPHCLVNDRLVGHGDFRTPEQQVPADAPAEPWEVCLTMNESWGWTSDDHRWKSVPTIIGYLVDTITAGGNLLLNVGPTGEGAFPAEATERLRALGRWVAANNEAVYGLDPAPEGLSAPVPLASKSHDDGDRVYVYCTLRPWDRLAVSGVPVRRVTGVRVVSTGGELAYDAVASLPEVHAGATDPRGDLLIAVPEGVADSLVPVLEIQLSRA